ncbi:Gfo/Idh/MocA family oxidoreductase [Bremerella sp. JC770]|uniref:Gfo/Idh/MocA family protein n=1 Tax=Bremerella sp. JC770 TaxID=3232137 RepID=UPI00345A8BCE
MAQLDHHVLIVGTGSIGLRHLRCFLATGRAAVSFVEPRDEVRSSIVHEYPHCRGYRSLEEALAQGDFNSAVIATPAPMHVPQAIQLLENRIPVLIEKPLTLDLASAECLAAAARKASSIVGVAYVYRANPLLAQMRDSLLSGEFGTPVELIAYGGQNFPTYRPAYRDTYYNDRATGGGAIQDALTHVFNAAQWLVGDMQKIVVDAEHQVLGGVSVEDTVHAIARHEGNILASYTLNQHQPANELTMTVVCEQGMLRMENHRQRWRVTRQPDTPWTDFPLPTLERDELFVRQADSFLDAIQGKSVPLCGLDEGIASLKANVAALASWKQGNWQHIS